MERISLENELKNNSYPGRGIIIGRSADGTKAVTAYFITQLHQHCPEHTRLLPDAASAK